MFVYQKRNLQVQFLTFGVDPGIIVPILKRSRDNFVQSPQNNSVQLPPATRSAKALVANTPPSR